MITLTRLNGTPLVLNSDLIETIEQTPDTTILLLNRHYFIVKESMEEVVGKVIDFRRQAMRPVGRSAYRLEQEGLGQA